MSPYWVEKKNVEKRLLLLENTLKELKKSNNHSNLNHDHFLNLNDNDKFTFIVKNNYWNHFHHLSENFIINAGLDSLLYKILDEEFESERIKHHDMDNEFKYQLYIKKEIKNIYNLENIINWITNPDKFVFNIIPPKFSVNFIKYYRKKYFDMIVIYLWFKDLKLLNPFLTEIDCIDDFPRKMFNLIYDEEFNLDKLSNINIENLIICIIIIREDVIKILKKLNLSKVKLEKDEINNNGTFKFKFPKTSNNNKNYNYISFHYYNSNLISNNESDSEILFQEGSFFWKVKRVWDQL